MGLRVEKTFFINHGATKLFNLLVNPKELRRIMPAEAILGVESATERPSIGDWLMIRVRMLGQVITLKLMVEELVEPSKIVYTSQVSDLSTIRHVIELREKNGGTVLRDVIEFKTGAGPLSDLLFAKAFSKIIDARNSGLLHILGMGGMPRYEDPVKLGNRLGATLSLLLSTLGLYLMLSLPSYDLLPGIVIGILGFALLWFWTHCLAHHVMGRILGVRFDNYYVGISNIFRLRRFPRRLRLAAVVLGIKIDRERSKTSARGLATMYLAGPAASILAPLLTALYVFVNNPGNYAIQVVLLVSLSNAIFTAYFSPKVGCVRKALAALRGGLG